MSQAPVEAAPPLIDVLIPAYNAGRTIGDTIASLAAQTLREFRILVVDDGSTDDTATVVAHARARDPRIVLLRQANAGITEARNAALRAATAPFVALQDADDLSDPDRLATELAFLTRHPDCVAVSCAARHIDRDGRPTGGLSIMRPLEEVDSAWVPAREPYLMPFALIRREALEAVGGYRHVDYAEDTDLYWRLRRVGRLVNLPEVLGSYRFHAESATGGGSLVSTRILAANNQLAALSSARQARGGPDIVFDRQRLGRLRAAGTLEAMVGAVEAELEDEERPRYRAACAAKMLQWIEGRRLRPDLADCRFMRRAYRERPVLAPRNHGELRRLYAVVGARLMRRGELAKAQALIPPAVLAEAGLRALLGRC